MSDLPEGKYLGRGQMSSYDPEVNPIGDVFLSFSWPLLPTWEALLSRNAAVMNFISRLIASLLLCRLRSPKILFR